MLKIPLYTQYHILSQVCRGFSKKIIVNHKNNLTEQRRMKMAKNCSNSSNKNQSSNTSKSGGSNRSKNQNKNKSQNSSTNSNKNANDEY